jgi:hypothetical protein
MRTRLFKKAEMNNVHLKAVEDLELYLPRVSLGEAPPGLARPLEALKGMRKPRSARKAPRNPEWKR